MRGKKRENYRRKEEKKESEKWEQKDGAGEGRETVRGERIDRTDRKGNEGGRKRTEYVSEEKK